MPCVILCSAPRASRNTGHVSRCVLVLVVTWGWLSRVFRVFALRFCFRFRPLQVRVFSSFDIEMLDLLHMDRVQDT